MANGPGRPGQALLLILAVLLAGGAVLLTGRTKPLANRELLAFHTEMIAAGVVLRQYGPGAYVPPECDVSVLEVDLSSTASRLRVAAEAVRSEYGGAWADARTIDDWCARSNAWGAVNGGYFGARAGQRKQVVGLLATEGMVRSSGRLVRARGNRDRFARSVLWIGRDGLPHIDWVTAQAGRRALLALLDSPANPAHQTYAEAVDAVGCGPALVRAGAVCVTDREERLVSPRRVPRTFVAYSTEGRRPRAFVMGVATSMDYRDVAAFLTAYFQREHGTACEAGMCLDGGSSSQLAFRRGDAYVTAPGSEVTVPTAVLVVPEASRPPKSGRALRGVTQ